jgi:hypothetical protein
MHRTYTTANITRSTIIDRHHDMHTNTPLTTKNKGRRKLKTEKPIIEAQTEDVYAPPPNLHVLGSTNLSIF